MPPKGRQVALGRAPAQKSYAQTVYQTITSPDNRSLMISISFFATGVAFLHSSWSEILLPPL